MRTPRSVAVHLATSAIWIAALGQTLPAQASGQEFTCKGKDRVATIVGTNGADVLSGTSGRDVIVGRGGSDEIRGMGGNDIICGDADQRSGTDGSDRLFGGSGHDTIDGGRGRDRLHGGDGNDYLVGGLGSDLLSGVAGRDRLFGGSGDDQISGGTGDDQLNGGLNKDHCDGGAGIDGGTLCEGETTSIALLSFASVSFHRPPGGGVTCDLLVDIVNEGSEPAKEVRVEATFKTLAFPGPVGADLELKGAADIPEGNTAHYFQNTGVQVQQGDIVRYVVRVHNGATSVDTARSEGGIPCAD